MSKTKTNIVSTYCVPGIFLGTGDEAVSLHLRGRGRWTKQINKKIFFVMNAMQRIKIVNVLESKGMTTPLD